MRIYLAGINAARDEFTRAVNCGNEGFLISYFYVKGNFDALRNEITKIKKKTNESKQK